MFGVEELKESIRQDRTTIECPVRKCTRRVKIMHNGEPRLVDSYLATETPDGQTQGLKDWFCKKHGIYIAQSTFIYDNLRDSLLWYDEEDQSYIEQILKKKRVKAQLFHDRSEDAATWAVFRYLEKEKLASGFLGKLTGTIVKSPQLIYWSYSPSEQNTWSDLGKARKEFGEEEERGSEPDLIIMSDNALFFHLSSLARARSSFSPLVKCLRMWCNSVIKRRISCVIGSFGAASLPEFELIAVLPPAKITLSTLPFSLYTFSPS